MNRPLARARFRLVRRPDPKHPRRPWEVTDRLTETVRHYPTQSLAFLHIEARLAIRPTRGAA